ncbi:MAG: DUF1615 family protein, partial [Azonexus sp.]
MFQPARVVAPCLAVAIVAGCAGTGEPLPGGTVPVGAPPSGPEIRAMVVRLIPASVRDRSGWADDLYSAFSSLDLPHAPQVYCAAIAIIEQESSFQADPVVPNLPDIVWRELEQRGRRYGIPKLLISAALLKTSPDGRSYSQRIDTLRTEKQLNALFEDMIAELPAGKTLFAGYNPVRTGGPMQVS